MKTFWASAVFIACALSVPRTTTLAQDGQTTPNLMAAYAKAFGNKDSDVLAALYGEDAVLLPPNEPVVKGRAAIRSWYVKTFHSGFAGLRLESTSFTQERPDAYVAFEWGEYSVVRPPDRDGGERRVKMKYVWSLRKFPTGWFIASHMFNSDE